MDIGELVLIEDSRLSVEQRVLWAAGRYQRKYGRKPTLCLLHPSLLNGKRKRVAGLKLEPRKSVLPNYLWVGIAEASLTPLAR